MRNVQVIAAFWFLASLIATIVAYRLNISIALIFIILGAIMGFTA